MEDGRRHFYIIYHYNLSVTHFRFIGHFHHFIPTAGRKLMLLSRQYHRFRFTVGAVRILSLALSLAPSACPRIRGEASGPECGPLLAGVQQSVPSEVTCTVQATFAEGHLQPPRCLCVLWAQITGPFDWPNSANLHAPFEWLPSLLGYSPVDSETGGRIDYLRPLIHLTYVYIIWILFYQHV